MDEKLQAVLAQLKLAPGARVHSARMVTEPDGGEFARVLVDEGIGGMKVHMLTAKAQSAPSLVEEPEAPGLPTPLTPLPEREGGGKPKRVVTKRQKK